MRCDQSSTDIPQKGVLVKLRTDEVKDVIAGESSRKPNLDASRRDAAYYWLMKGSALTGSDSKEDVL